MNKFEDSIIEKAIMTKGNAAEVASFFFQYVNNPSLCEGMFERTLTGDNSSELNIVCAKMFNTYYFLSDLRVSEKEHRMQISSLEDYHIVHLIYSNYLMDTPILTVCFNDLNITETRVDLVNYSWYLVDKNIYTAKNYLEEVVLCSPKTSDWYYQRTMVAHILQDFLKFDKNCTLVDEEIFEYDKQRFYFLSFRYDNSLYFWIDVLIGTDVYCSHLETISNEKVEVLFASESSDRTFIPHDSEVKALIPIYHRLK